MVDTKEEKPACHPIVNGGCYTHNVTGEEAVIMGVQVDPNSKKRVGNLYTFGRGPLPSQVIEDSDSMRQWSLVAAPSKKTATGIVSVSKRSS